MFIVNICVIDNMHKWNDAYNAKMLLHFVLLST